MYKSSLPALRRPAQRLTSSRDGRRPESKSLFQMGVLRSEQSTWMWGTPKCSSSRTPLSVSYPSPVSSAAAACWPERGDNTGDDFILVVVAVVMFSSWID